MTVKLSVDRTVREMRAYNIIVYCYYHYHDHIIQESGAAIDSKAFLGILLKLT